MACTKIKERFVDLNLERQAQIQIKALTQGSDMAEDFFQKFEILLTQAEYKKEDLYVIQLLEMNVNNRIIDIGNFLRNCSLGSEECSYDAKF